MGRSALTERLQETSIEPESTHEVRADAGSRQESPGIRFLEAMRSGDDLGVIDTCGETTTMSAQTMGWSCEGTAEIIGILAEARRCFPGLTVEPRTRDIGFGLVIDEVRVQDLLPPSPTEAKHLDIGDTEDTEDMGPDPDRHPMWDQPVSEDRTVAVWREDYLTPMRLNLPVRITVRHDDLQVHDITLDFPAALLKRALGIYVDPLEMSLSEVQSAIIAPVEAEFTTRHTLAGAHTLAPASPREDEAEVVEEVRPRRRRRLLVPALIMLVALAAAGGWWASGGQIPGVNNAAQAVAPVTATSAAPQPSASVSPSATSASASTGTTQASQGSSQAPVVTHAKPSDTPTRKPNVTLKSDLAFAFNSSTLSPQAKSAIDHVAHQVRRAGLTGKIYVEGYTDDLGSKAYGLVLSQRRADAVSHYLGSQLVGVPVTIVSTGHGEADPVADNATNAGRKANRRVTITLPHNK
jgi:outer membrane protein OmpA-like peptidoglycan-associated protein